MTWLQGDPMTAIETSAGPTLTDERPAWQDQAACRGCDPDLFFPSLHENATNAKRICRECDVRRECLDYALANGEHHGVWGGLSFKERQRLRGRRL